LKWTKEEEAILTKKYPDLFIPIRDVVEALPGRSLWAIQKKANVMGLSRIERKDPIDLIKSLERARKVVIV
jgi:hypothetical protein